MSRSNRNPLKHGPYEQHVSPAEAGALRRLPLEELEQEIHILRVSLERLMKLGREQSADVEAQTKISRSVALLVRTLNETLRTRSLLGSSGSALEEALAGALLDEAARLSGPPPRERPPGPGEPSGPEADLWRQVFSMELPGRKKR